MDAEVQFPKLEVEVQLPEVGSWGLQFDVQLPGGGSWELRVEEVTAGDAVKQRAACQPHIAKRPLIHLDECRAALLIALYGCTSVALELCAEDAQVSWARGFHSFASIGASRFIAPRMRRFQ